MHNWQWSYQASNTKGAYLPDQCDEMVSTRQAHRAQRAMNNVPWQLTLNFDQLWRAAWEPPQKCCTRDGQGKPIGKEMILKKLGRMMWWEKGSPGSRLGRRRYDRQNGANHSCFSTPAIFGSLRVCGGRPCGGHSCDLHMGRWVIRTLGHLLGHRKRACCLYSSDE